MITPYDGRGQRLLPMSGDHIISSSAEDAPRYANLARYCRTRASYFLLGHKFWPMNQRITSIVELYRLFSVVVKFDGDAMKSCSAIVC